MERKRNELGELYERHALELNRLMLRLTRNREDAADLVHDVFLKLFRLPSLPEHAREWMALTGYRLFVDRWRRGRRAAGMTFEPASPALFVAPEQAVLDRELDGSVRGLLRRFASRRRTVLYLRLYEEASCMEIARRLGCPENTVKSDIRRGRRQLSGWLTEEREDWRTNVRKKTSQPSADRP